MRDIRKERKKEVRQNEPPPFWVYFFEKMLPTGEMLKMLKI